MSAESTSSTNPVVRAVVSGAAPPQARMAAARGLLPLAQEELLELLVALRSDAGEGGGLSLEDAWLIAQHIEVSDDDIDDSWLPSEWMEELIEETFEERHAAATRLVAEATGEAAAPERVALIRR